MYFFDLFECLRHDVRLNIFVVLTGNVTVNVDIDYDLATKLQRSRHFLRQSVPVTKWNESSGILSSQPWHTHHCGSAEWSTHATSVFL